MTPGKSPLTQPPRGYSNGRRPAPRCAGAVRRRPRPRAPRLRRRRRCGGSGSWRGHSCGPGCACSPWSSCRRRPAAAAGASRAPRRSGRCTRGPARPRP
eukprot:6858005-Alexandrium_andersonii.AAC.1